MSLREQFEKETGKCAKMNGMLLTYFNSDYVQWLEQRNKEQVEVLIEARKAIYNASADAFGSAVMNIDGKDIPYPLKDELLNNIDKTLNKSHVSEDV